MIQNYFNSFYSLAETVVSSITNKTTTTTHHSNHNYQLAQSPSREDWDLITPTLSEPQLNIKKVDTSTPTRNRLVRKDDIELDSNQVTLLSGSTETNLVNLLSPTSINSSPSPDTPIFFVDGFMSFPVVDIWANVIAHFRHRAYQCKVPCPPLHRLYSGGVASAHDVAVSLFYQIKGGTEDFGKEHSNTHRHDRHGLHHMGLYKQWSSEFPIHMLAHSYGGNVIMHLQRLLDAKFFLDENGVPYDTNADWILSAAMVSSPLRGTTCAIVLGMVPGQPGKLKPLSFGRMLYFVTHAWEWLEWHDPREGWLGINFRMSHFGLGRNRSFRKLVTQLFGSELFDRGLDTSAEGFQLEKYFQNPYKTFDTTYYRTYAASMTRPSATGEERAIPHWITFLRFTANVMGNFDFKRDGQGQLDPLIRFQSSWRKNDGVCPLISQCHPENCDKLSCHHTSLPSPHKPHSPTLTLPHQLHPGTWYCSTVPDCSHVDLIPGFELTPHSGPLRFPRRLFTGLLHPFAPTSSYSSTQLDNELATSVRHYRRTFMEDYLQFLVKIEIART